jgi:hypothetical protein
LLALELFGPVAHRQASPATVGVDGVVLQADGDAGEGCLDIVRAPNRQLAVMAGSVATGIDVNAR